MTIEINVPDIYDNHEILANAFQSFLDQHIGVHCAVREPAESPDWIFALRLSDGRRKLATLHAYALMQHPELLAAFIRDGLNACLQRNPEHGH